MQKLIYAIMIYFCSSSCISWKVDHPAPMLTARPRFLAVSRYKNGANNVIKNKKVVPVLTYKKVFYSWSYRADWAKSLSQLDLEERMQESHWTETFLFPAQMVPTCCFSTTLYCLKSAKVLLHLVKCLLFLKKHQCKSHTFRKVFVSKSLPFIHPELTQREIFSVA